jgi:hypothetical protein
MQKQRKMHTQIKDTKYNEYHARVMEDMKNPRMMRITVTMDTQMKKVAENLRKAFEESIVGKPSFQSPIFDDSPPSIIPPDQRLSRAFRPNLKK